MRPGLRPYLDAVVAGMDREARLAADPVAFVHRYDAPADQEVAAVLSATLAYGRVAAFRPVLASLFAIADEAGGPRAWVDGFDPERDGPPVRPLFYRWNRGVDWILLAMALRDLYREHPSLEALVPPGAGAGQAADAVVGAIREAAVRSAEGAGLRAGSFAELPRGVRYLLPRPASGSACKRWMMFLRWMCRTSTDGIDLGLWRAPTPARLVIPLDTHVLRISRFLGLTERRDGSWRTALEVTAALRTLDPDDPVRYDFAIAHLGISGACRGHRHPEACPSCPLDRVCTAGPM